MGGCASNNSINVVSKARNQSYNHNKNQELKRSGTTKTFPTGEVYYLKHKEAEVKGNVMGGRDKIQISFSLKVVDDINNINNINGGSINFNAKVAMFMSSFQNKDQLNFIGETEELEEGSLNFHTTYIIDYFFEKTQLIKFEIKDGMKKLDTIQTNLGRLMGARRNIAEFQINLNQLQNQNPGQKIILVVNVATVKEVAKNTYVNFHIEASFNSNQEYFVIFSKMDKGKPQRVYKSREIRGQSVIFNVQNINLNDISSIDKTSEIQFDFYSTNNVGVLGEIKTNMTEITYSEHMGISAPKGGQIGTCKIYSETEQRMKFVEYLEKGLQMSLIVGIDYTASNGVPSDKNSLHYLFGREPNHYEQAIRSCGNIVAYYDYDQKFPVFGFGGILKGTHGTSHCFNCNQCEDPNVDGLEGIISTYRKSLNSIILDGPTYFYPLIKNMVDFVRYESQRAQSSVYYILLLLTDGQIHDMDMTRDIICEAATLPISIIIIGIGEDDFYNMIELDGDNEPLTNKRNERIVRDVVQFVKFNDFKSDSNKLAEEVLFEIPTQVESYYKLYKNFKGLDLY